MRTFLIITTAANEMIRPIHEDWPARLDEQQDGDPSALLRPPDQGVLRAWSVSPLVNSPRNDSPDLLEPLELPVA